MVIYISSWMRLHLWVLNFFSTHKYSNAVYMVSHRAQLTLQWCGKDQLLFKLHCSHCWYISSMTTSLVLMFPCNRTKLSKLECEELPAGTRLETGTKHTGKLHHLRLCKTSSWLAMFKLQLSLICRFVIMQNSSWVATSSSLENNFFY